MLICQLFKFLHLSLLKQVVRTPLPNAQQQARVSLVLEDDHIIACPTSQYRCVILKNPHCSQSMSANYKSKFAVLKPTCICVETPNKQNVIQKDFITWLLNSMPAL